MKGVNIDTLTQGSTGLILSRLNERNLEDAKLQLKNEKERQERFMNEPVTSLFDYKGELRRKENKEIGTSAEDVYAYWEGHYKKY